jgi:hypothetical protein
MNVAAQIKKYKGHVEVFSGELYSLIQSFEILLPIAEDAELLTRYRRTHGAPGLLVTRDDLIRNCVLGITRLTYDKGTDKPDRPPANRSLSRPKARAYQIRTEEGILEAYTSFRAAWGMDEREYRIFRDGPKAACY